MGLLGITGCRKLHLKSIRLIQIAHFVWLGEFADHVKNNVTGRRYLHKRNIFFLKKRNDGYDFENKLKDKVDFFADIDK